LKAAEDDGRMANRAPSSDRFAATFSREERRILEPGIAS
jgi:hypothetical protein